jgi:2-isopropylmalate synthase
MDTNKNDVLIYDCTLRDGTQGEHISLSVQDKLLIAQRLDEFGIRWIEGGWPGSNPKDADFFEKAKRVEWKIARIAAFGSTRHWKNPVEKDPNLQALLDADTPTVTLVGKSWDFHVLQALGIELDQNLQIIRESVMYMKEHDKEVVFDAEHFFDGYRENPDYSEQVLEVASEAGADWLVLCDTNGGNLPSYLSDVVGKTCSKYERVGIHTHNDCGLGVANTVVSVEAGAQMVQGTMNGYGERIGNANLTSVIPTLELKLNRNVVGKNRLGSLTSLAYFISETANVALPNTDPYVGRSAFAHKGGIHVSAILKDSRTYEHIDPAAVGNSRRVLVSDLSGKSNLLYKIREFGDLNLERLDLNALLQEIKRLEYEGYQFEGAEASLKLLVNQFTGASENPFDVEGFRVVVDQARDGGFLSEATVKVSVADGQEHTASDGIGPVHALNLATKKALKRFFPEIESIHLTDYKVRVLDARDGTAAKVRVLVQSTDGTEVWTTIGVSANVIEASWLAIIDSLLYRLVFRPVGLGA